MRRLIKAWLPRGSTPESRGLTVPYSGQQKMTRQLFEMILKSRLRKLIDQDQQEAYNVLSRSPEYNPDLYTIALHNQPKDWPILIVMCDQMQMWLNRIDWSKPGQNLSLEPIEMSSLEAITETLPR